MPKKTLYFENMCGYEVCAATLGGVLTDFQIENTDNGSIVGNIYKGKVCDTLDGMQAAFVNCGLERNCYLSADDFTADASKYDGEIKGNLSRNLKVGDEIMVQVVKAPVGNKGAKVTTNLTFVGKYSIYMPETPFVGVSAKIVDAELKRNLIFGASKVVDGNEGIVVRTAAPYAHKSVKLEEIDYFRKIYHSIREKFETAKAGELLYSDYPLHMRVLRDILASNIQEVHVGTEALESDVNTFFKTLSNHFGIEVIPHGRQTDMFFELGLSDQIKALLQPRVELENGAYLVIEKTEALTVIDVNTGKFIGDDSLEQTVYRTNILAAREIARQVRLRDIGGIIVVDFIDMQNENHRLAIVEELKLALKGDKAKCKVLPMSKLGLIEFTRKRTGASPLNYLSKQCKVCRGAGSTLSTGLLLYGLRANLLSLLSKGHKTVCIDMNFDLANKLLAAEEIKSSVQNAYPQARVYITSHRTYREETINFRVEDSSDFALPKGTVLLY